MYNVCEYYVISVNIFYLNVFFLFIKKVLKADRKVPPFSDRGPLRKKEKKPRRFAKSKEWGDHIESRFKTEVSIICLM